MPATEATFMITRRFASIIRRPAHVTKDQRSRIQSSEGDLRRELNLTTRECFGVLPVSRDRIGRERARPEDVVDFRVVGAVEKVEDVDDGVQRAAATEREPFAEPGVDDELSLH